MISRRITPVAITWMAYDLPWHTFAETVGTLYRRGRQHFHLLLREPAVNIVPSSDPRTDPFGPTRLLWLEIGPNRLTLTMQGDGNSQYRHLFKPGAQGISSFWLREQRLDMRNFTRALSVSGSPSSRTRSGDASSPDLVREDDLPTRIQTCYDLWIANQKLGSFQLDIQLGCRD